jgi:prepilin-type N-terminal cleavage/methylation domain-containing protein
MTRPSRGHRRSAFTLVEILVVIALIGVLAGILLVAVGGATTAAKTVRTKATMESLSAAIDSFVIEHGAMPGIVPVAALQPSGSAGSWITSTQNILLHLMGGARVSPMSDDVPLNAAMEAEYNRFKNVAEAEDGVIPVSFTLNDAAHNITYQVVVRTPRIGEGPWINGSNYAPYLSPKESELIEQWPWGYDADLPDGPENQAVLAGFTALPDLVDAWGQPIIVLKRERSSGPILVPTDDIDTLPQFRINGIDRYLGATTLGNMQSRQLCRPGEAARGSRLGEGSNNLEREYWLYLLLSHPAMRWDWDNGGCEGTGRAGYVMISPGPDGTFLARQDGPRDDNTGVPIPAGDFPMGGDNPDDHSRLKDFDDVVMYGGS